MEAQRSLRPAYLSLAALLLLSFVVSLLIAHAKLFWQDEFFEFFSDSRPTFAAVLQGQRLAPFSLEPPAFHLLLHALQKLPLRPEISTRLPAAFGLLFLEASAFGITLRLTRNSRAALLAAVLPMFFATVEYSAEARVYSLLAGAYSLAFLCYSRALSTTGRSRTLATIGLFLCLSACVLLHYHGVLLPLPFLVAEIFRRPRSRATLAAVCLSLCTFALNLPFMPAARAVQHVYYDSGEARPDMLLFTYIWIPFNGHLYHAREHHNAIFVLFLILTAVLLVAALVFLLRRRRDLPAGAPDRSLLLALAAALLVPAFNVVIGMATAHAYSPRYALPSAFTLAVVMAMAATPILSRFRFTAIFIPLLLLGSPELTRRQIRAFTLEGRIIHNNLNSPIIDTLLHQAGFPPQTPIYMQDTVHFLPAYYYAPPELRRRLVLLESVPFEYKWNHSAVSGIFGRNMALSTTLPTATWEDLSRHPGRIALVTFHSGADWLAYELSSADIPVQSLGSALGGELLEVSIPPTYHAAPPDPTLPTHP